MDKKLQTYQSQNSPNFGFFAGVDWIFLRPKHSYLLSFCLINFIFVILRPKMSFTMNGQLFRSPFETLILKLWLDIASLASLAFSFYHDNFLDSEWTTLYPLGKTLQNSSTLKELVLYAHWEFSTLTDPDVVENAKKFLKCVSHNRVLNNKVTEYWCHKFHFYYIKTHHVL